MLNRCYLEITNVCNLDCIFCPGHNRAARSLSMDEFLFLTDRLMGQVKFLYFHLMGEPCSHPLLTEFIGIAREKGFIPVLTTNGTLLDDRLLESLPYKTNISLHAFEGNDGQNPAEYINKVSCFSRKASDLGCIVVLRLWNQGGYDDRNGEILDCLKQHFPEPWITHTKGFELAPRVYVEFDSMFDWPDNISSGHEDDSRGEGLFCYALRNQIGVLADGTVVPCCLDHNGRMALGNLFDDKLETILKSDRAKAIFDGFSAHRAVEPMCQGCGYANVTKRHRMLK